MADKKETHFERMIRVTDARGHAGEWATDQSKRDIKGVAEYSANLEWSAANDLLEILLTDEQFGRITLDSNPVDPPDCLVRCDGRTIGVEVTELVDSNILQQIVRNKRHNDTAAPIDLRPTNSNSSPLFLQAQWDEPRLLRKLSQCIDDKNKKYAKRSIIIDVLLVVTAEPWLSGTVVRNALSQHALDPPVHIRTAYLRLPYMPGPEGGTPIHRLFGPSLPDLLFQ